MMTAAELMVHALVAEDDSRSRSTQTTLGPSQLMGCRAQAWLTIRDEPKTNLNALRLPAIQGTLFHAGVKTALDRLDPWASDYQTELTVTRDGITGHIDLYRNRTVTDWKTGKKRNAGRFPSAEQITQVQVYGWLLGGAEAVDYVELVFIPRDGTELDIKTHREAYDEARVLMALEWKADVESRTEIPDPERPAKTFCADYCQFYGRCPGVK